MRHAAPWLVGLLLVLCVGGTTAAEEAPLRAGFGSVDLTPQLPVPLGGYGSLLPRMAKSVHDPIEAHACVLEQGGQRVALVSVDFVGVSARMTEDVVRATRDLDMPLVLAATHTHSSFGGLTEAPLWRPMMGPFDQKLYDATQDRLVQCIRAAVADLAPATLSYAMREVKDFSRNRRVKDGPIDPRLRVLRIDAPDGSPRGLLVGFAAHPTFLGVENSALGAGWPGALRKALKKKEPAVTVLFLNGAMGDVSPKLTPSWTTNVPPPKRPKTYGSLLAGEVATTARQATPLRPKIGVAVSHARGASVADRLLGDADATGFGLNAYDRLPMFRVSLAPGLDLVTVPGEPTVAAGLRIEQALPKTDVWIVSCAVDHVGYFADRASFRRGGYEADMSFFGPGAADALAEAVGGLATQPRTPPPTSPTTPVRFTSDRKGLPGKSGPYRLGYDHGLKLRAEIHGLLEAAEPALIAHAKQAGIDRVTMPLSIASAGAVQPDELIIPLLVRTARTLQTHIPAEYLDEMEGVADGASVAYDAILLLNTFLTLAEQTDPTAMLSLPVRCTNVVAFGDATCMGQMLHASTLDWGMGEVLRSRARVMVFEPAKGHPFVSVGWPGMVGTLRAMNAQGLSITEESCAAPEDTRLAGTPLPFVLRHAIQHTDELDDAVRAVTAAPGTCGYKVTIADGPRMDARTVGVTASHHQVRKPHNGLLYGVDPLAPDEQFEGGKADAAIPRSDGSSLRRYAALGKLIEPGRQCLRRSLLAWALSQRDGGILNNHTLLACVFEPSLLRFHVALGDDVPVDDPAGALQWKTFDLRTLLGAQWRRHDPLRKSHAVVPVWRDLKPLLGMRRAEVVFDSPHPSGRSFNDVVKAEAWLPTEAPKGVVIHLPAWKERSLAAHRFLAATLARKGIATVILPLPYQHGRTAPGERPGQRTLSSNLAQTRHAMIQGLVEIRALGRHLQDKFGVPLGVSGVSLGGHVAAVAYGASPELFEGGAFILAGGNVIDAFVLPNSVTGGIQRELARRGVTLAEARELSQDFEPLAYADAKRGANVLIVAANRDDVVAPNRVRALSKAYGDAKIVWLDGGHYAPVRPDQAARLVKAVGEHLANVLGGE